MDNKLTRINNKRIIRDKKEYKVYDDYFSKNSPSISPWSND